MGSHKIVLDLDGDRLRRIEAGNHVIVDFATHPESARDGKWAIHFAVEGTQLEAWISDGFTDLIGPDGQSMHLAEDFLPGPYEKDK